jgi:hypothetical protein
VHQSEFSVELQVKEIFLHVFFDGSFESFDFDSTFLHSLRFHFGVFSSICETMLTSEGIAFEDLVHRDKPLASTKGEMIIHFLFVIFSLVEYSL